MARPHERATDVVPRVAHDAPAQPHTSASNADSTPPSLVELLDGGRDGHPRELTLPAMSTAGLVRLARVIKDAGESRGFLPIDVEAHEAWRITCEELRSDRTLLLIARPGVSRERAAGALLKASADTPRAHVLVMLRVSGTTPMVREARARYGGATAIAPLVAPLDRDAEKQKQRAARAADFASRGRHAAAARLFRDVIGALNRRGRYADAATARIQLGRLLLERGQIAAADRVFDEAAVESLRAHAHDSHMLARLWQAAARTDAGRLTEAESLCRAAIALCPATDSIVVCAQALLARVMLWQGRIRDAVSLELSNSSTQRLDDEWSCFVKATAVRVLVANGQIFEAGVVADDVAGRVAGAAPLIGVMARTARLRVLLASGQLSLARLELDEILRLTRVGRLPLRALRARALYAVAVQRAGHRDDAARELGALRRLSRVLPPLMRRAMATAAPSESPAVVYGQQVETRVDAAMLVTLAHDVDNDDDAIRRVMKAVQETLHASRVDIWSHDAGPPAIVMNLGAGLPTRLGPRTLEAGFALGPEQIDHGHETSVPLRRGTQTTAALTIRWMAGVTPPHDARALLELAAAVIRPRLEAREAAARLSAQAAAVVPELVGVSAGIRDVRAAIARAAAAPFAVLIQGESGVGKELAARAIHQLSPRRQRQFSDVNCAALPDDLLESELFGHARGAFTGAVTERRGLFEAADGGTIFLDEIAELSARGQAKLLRVLQQHEVRRVGETFSRPIDVRVVAATNRELAAEAASGSFRGDLLYRLDVIRLRIPPLRERPEDIAALVQHFWSSASARVGTTATLTHGTFAALTRYHWPGNVRELQNVVAALAVAAPSRGNVRPHLLPAAITGAALVTSPRLVDARLQFERRAIESALARAGGNRSRAARELGLSRQGLLKMMARLNVRSHETIVARKEKTESAG